MAKKAAEAEAPDRAAEAVAGMSKMDAVRAALAELGPDAKPKDAVPWIQSKYGLDIQPGIFSSYKRSINLAAEEAPATPSSTRAAPRKAAAPLGTAPATSDPAEAVRQVRQLVDKWGVEFVRELVDLFGPGR